MPTLQRADTPMGAWRRGLLARAHPNVAVVALAAKRARIVRALPHHGRTCEAAPSAAAA
jgi:poly-gamma-glutamate capsule biosynthesis protein CapA/YwtB (metallophosphatase superfamily)